jgi:magnesium transporter
VGWFPQQNTYLQVEPTSIRASLNDGAVVWLDVPLGDSDSLPALLEDFSLHPLAIEELAAVHPRPRAAEFPEQFLFVLFAASYEDSRIEMRQLVLFLGDRWLISAHHAEFPELGECERRWKNGGGIRSDSAASLLYAVLDTVVDGYFPVLDILSDRMDDIEHQFLRPDMDADVTDLFDLKRDLLVLRRAVSGQRDAVNQFMRQGEPLLREAEILYFQSVYDHLVRILETIDTYRDLAAGAMDLHLAVVSNRMNQIMKTLTVISTILMTCGLVAGVYGMNFKHMPELEWTWGYGFSVGLMGLLSVVLLIVFRRLKWL